MERKTRQRAAIRAVLDEAGRPMSPEEIHQAAKRHVRALGIATVYRAVKALCDEGELQVVSLPGENDRYEVTGLDHHHHFRCNSCEKVFDIEGCPGHLRTLVPRNFRLERHDLVLYGECATCLKAS